MKYPDVLKESVSPDSFKDIYLRVLSVSSAAGGEINQVLLKIGTWRRLSSEEKGINPILAQANGTKKNPAMSAY